ncbi:MAG: hypothetical protein F4174_03005 [Acidobacteria bacterium]|nr:hypothetical protein [Acidobacteriota bacterium]
MKVHRSSHRLRRLCPILGALLAAGPSIAGQSRPPNRITVATWNIAWFGDGIRDGVLRGNQRGGRCLRAEGALARRRCVVSRLADLDVEVVGLQEVENTAAVRRIFPEEDWDLFLSTRETDPEWSQRTAIVVRRAAGWRVERHPDVVEWSPQGRDRHGVDLTLIRGQERVRVLTLHFQSGCNAEPLRSPEPRCGFLRMQFAVLKGWLFERMAEGVPTVVAGDWNRFLSRPGDEAAAGLPGGPRVLPSPGSAPACWDGYFDHYVDHIVAFAPRGREVAPTAFEEVLYGAPRSARDRLSDHCPLVATLGFTAPN